MALDGDVLGLAIDAAVNAVDVPTDGPISDSARQDMWKVIGNAIVDHFTNNAVISTTGQATGVVSGGAVAPTASTGTMLWQI